MAIQYGREYYIRLTRRQQEVLKALVKIYLESQAPVSYKEIAEFVGISKWTSYDIIQEIVKKGFANAYYKPKNGPGRTEVLYIPKEVAIDRISDLEPSKSQFFVKKWVSNQIKKFSKQSPESYIKEISNKIIDDKNPLNIVLYVITLLILLSNTTKREIESIINMKSLLSQEIHAPILLSFLVEINFAQFFCEKIHKERKTDLDNLIKNVLNRFRENIYLISPSSQRRLVEYLKTTLI